MASDLTCSGCGHRPEECQRARNDSEAPALRARLTEAERLLRELEWSAWRSDNAATCCVQCAGEQPQHVPDCALARWLEGGGR